MMLPTVENMEHSAAWHCGQKPGSKPKDRSAWALELLYSDTLLNAIPTLLHKKF
jgi:hypothetical protein